MHERAARKLAKGQKEGWDLASRIYSTAVRGRVTGDSNNKSNSGKTQQTIKVRNAVEGTSQLSY